MINISIRSDVDKLKREFGKLSADKFNTGLARGVNKTIAQAKTEASKQIRQIYNLKADIVRDRLSIIKASRLTLTGELRANAAGN